MKETWKKSMRKILSCALVLVMVGGLLPMTVMAATTDAQQTDEYELTVNYMDGQTTDSTMTIKATPSNGRLTWYWDWPADPVSGDRVFKGWCTDKDGKGELWTASKVAEYFNGKMSFTTGDTFADAERTYYAIWEEEPSEYKVRIFITCGLEGDQSSVERPVQTYSGNTYTIPTLAELGIDSYTGFGYVYLMSAFQKVNPGDVIDVTDGEELVVVYYFTEKQENSKPETQEVSLNFDANTTDEVTGIPTDQKETINVGANHTFTIDNIEPTREGYHFTGWNTLPTPSAADAGDSYAAGSDIVVNNNRTLFAQWAVNTYEVAFHSNDGTGIMENQAFTYGVEQALTSNAFEKADAKFLGWATDKEASEVVYEDGVSVKNLTTTNKGVVNLYAVWEADKDVEVDPDGDSNADKDESAENPKTGDASNSMLWFALLVISMMSAAGTVFVTRRAK